MEKLLYVFWRGSDSAAALTERVRRELAPRLRSLGVERLQFNIADFGDLTGALVNFSLHSTQPAPDGLVSFWISSAFRRAPAEAMLRTAFARIAGYEVAESTVLPNLLHPPVPGERTYGFSQVTLLQVPPRLSYEEWRRVWFEEHTPVGIETQANFLYVHNVVVMPLTAEAPPFRGIVEECFPPQALRDSQAFYAAVGDEARHQRHQQRMMHSCAKFIDFDRIDVIATSQYRLHDAAEPAL
ncbi:MAG TPA: EthD domain-containing protein [Steroidobacteraceae bacterium]|nr:EthD domain-containing protein [Steroidobacteraceae bacterium]